MVKNRRDSALKEIGTQLLQICTTKEEILEKWKTRLTVQIFQKDKKEKNKLQRCYTAEFGVLLVNIL